MRRKRIILVLAGGQIEPECETSLKELERAGNLVHRVKGDTDLTRGRSQMATDALAEGFEELIWIDSDIQFSPESVDRLSSHNLPYVGGLYPIKEQGRRRWPCKPLPGDNELVFGEEGGLKQLTYLTTGFLLTHREVYLSVQEKFALPRCASVSRHGLVPYFQQMVIPSDDGNEFYYLSSGFSFCERVRQCGYPIMADTTIRLGHIGKRFWTWDPEPAEGKFKSFRYRIDGSR